MASGRISQARHQQLMKEIDRREQYLKSTEPQPQPTANPFADRQPGFGDRAETKGLGPASQQFNQDRQQYEHRVAMQQQMHKLWGYRARTGESPLEGGDITTTPEYKQLQQSNPAQAQQLLEHSQWLKGIQEHGGWDAYQKDFRQYQQEMAPGGAKPYAAGGRGGDVAPGKDNLGAAKPSNISTLPDWLEDSRPPGAAKGPGQAQPQGPALGPGTLGLPENLIPPATYSPTPGAQAQPATQPAPVPPQPAAKATPAPAQPAAPAPETTEGKPKQDLSVPDTESHFTDPAMAEAARRRAETMPLGLAAQVARCPLGDGERAADGESDLRSA
jgi:hypothetical protein